MAKWIHSGDLDEDALINLEDLGYSPVLAQLLLARGISTTEEAEYFFNLSLSKLHNPYDLPNILKATSRIIKAIELKEKIFIWGDYDVDGITSTAVMITALKKFGADFEWHVPHRINDGYDIKPDSIKKVLTSGAKLLITVDCGILAFEAAEFAKENSLDLIITDHHTPSDDKRVPNCIAVINPKIKGSAYPFNGLAGVGIAFKVVCALANELGYSIKEIVRDTIEYVALGTVADVAPMTDENRILVHHGCKQLNKSTKPGIKALIKVCRTTNLDSTNIGFTVAPRINAIGRLSDPKIALNLLITDDDDSATIWAQELEEANLHRQKIQADAIEDALRLVDDSFEPHKDKCIVIANQSWPMGIVGLISGKLAEQFSVPALVGHIKDDGFIKGSCRSSQGIDILKCLKHPDCYNLFKEKKDGSKILGGHSFAAGFEIADSNLPLLRLELSKYINSNYPNLEFNEKIYNYDIVTNISYMNSNTLNDILKMAPFGSENYLPTFMVKNAVIDSISTISSGKHLKLSLKSSLTGFNNYDINALWWNKGDKINDYPAGSSVKALVQMDMSFNPRNSLTLFVSDMVINGKVKSHE